ncbi:MAG TPA: AMP-binding protein, partial [Ilumatobacteraceae bacterium]|nr:AMP-binding protein [Ilumatobacteraceae bacterium]
MDPATPTFASQLLAQANNEGPAVYFEDQTISYRDFVSQAKAVAAYINQRVDRSKPPHIGVLLENTPDYLLWIAGAAFARAVIVGINPTRRGAELERDLGHTDCQFVVTDHAQADLLPRSAELLCVDDADYATVFDDFLGVEDPIDHDAERVRTDLGHDDEGLLGVHGVVAEMQQALQVHQR